MLEKTNGNIEINEEKGIKNTILYVKNVPVNVESYETKILLEENIDKILKFQIVYEGESRTLQFDVSNTISFEEYLKQNSLRKENICDVIDQIDSVISSVENYLISENSISLDMKLIRVVKKKNRRFGLLFVALPNYKSDFSYELSRFLIKILRYIDVDDKDALSLAYGLFVRSSKDNYTITDLIEITDAVRDNGIESLREFDIAALNSYDEEIASELSQSEEFDDRIMYMESDDTNVINDNKKIIDEGKEQLSMDNETKKIINDELFDKFDDEPNKNKVVKFKKKLFDFKSRKSLNAHISFAKLSFFIPLLALVVVPTVFYVIYGPERFLNYAVVICVYEFIILTFLSIKGIKEM